MDSRAKHLRQRLLGSHRAWVKEGKRTLIIPVHGPTVREHVVRQVLEATSDDERADSSGG